jgi:hypothetical protein
VRRWTPRGRTEFTRIAEVDVLAAAQRRKVALVGLAPFCTRQVAMSRESWSAMGHRCGTNTTPRSNISVG